MSASPLIAVLNHLLSREPLLTDSLAAHAGKSAQIDAGIRLRFAVAADGLLQAVATQTDEASVTISKIGRAHV